MTRARTRRIEHIRPHLHFSLPSPTIRILASNCITHSLGSRENRRQQLIPDPRNLSLRIFACGEFHLFDGSVEGFRLLWICLVGVRRKSWRRGERRVGVEVGVEFAETCSSVGWTCQKIRNETMQSGTEWRGGGENGPMD